MKRVVLAGLAALFAGGMSIALHAWSQTAPGGPAGGPAAPGAHAQMAHHRGPMPLPSERVEPMLAFAKASLKITAAQESAWNAVADVVRKHAKARDEDVKKMRAKFDAARDAKTPPTPPNGIEMLQQQQQRLTQRAKDLDELLTAAKPLYASLSDDQKKAADRLLHHARGGMGGRGGPHMMGPH
ncbi:Spy/CpxP family protein refolding chaperone [Roseiterribacter gracilis]|uniref:LTXXQ motif family protein n=1 Tax=Roseiterribacter gracilis TaxID=2812848 RepID=A0A8S8XAV6_9PROT|nr:hypothetical protein TMPK1_21210 [Rhodospirillales bacterium TMPK1]